MENKNNQLQAAMEIARLANIRKHASRVKVPCPKDFKTLPVSSDPHEIFVYAKPPFMLQLVGDGLIYTIQKGETFDDRMNKVILDMKRMSKFFIPYKELTNKQGILFKTFVQDMIFPSNGEKKIVRAAVAFFADNNPLGAQTPVNPDFYQLVLSVGPFPYPPQQIKVGEISPDDQPTMNLLKTFEDILDRIVIAKGE